jgi:hypothetical protein
LACKQQELQNPQVKIWMVDRELQWLGFYCTFIPS